MSYTKTNVRASRTPHRSSTCPPRCRRASPRRAIDGETLGLSLFTLEPGFRSRSGTSTRPRKRCTSSCSGSARVKVDDEVVDLAEWDAIRFPKDTMRQMEAGPDGVEYLAFGARDDPAEVEMAPGWWSD
jgi:hypothetical protein